jgi:DNA-binding winged helix-turn-helix (wHTH) protein
MLGAVGDGGASEPREATTSSVRFDIFELDPKGCELRRNGLPVDVPPQALKILAHLVKRADTLVSREEIRAILWPNQSYGDFDSRLNFAVKKLREALGDDAERPRYVQTVRNAGYRFMAPVQKTTSASSVGQVKDIREEHETSRELPRPYAPLTVGMAAIVLALAVSATTIFLHRPRNPSSSAESDGRAKAAASSGIEFEPNIFSVSPILPLAKQRIVIKGRGFGFHTPYAQTDSAYLAIRDTTADWAGGRIVPQNWDEVMIDVEHWTDTEIVLSGFGGSYGQHWWKLTAGDQLEIAVWNPQSGAGPALYHVRVVPRKKP